MLLSTRKLAPSPANFYKVHAEITGSHDDEVILKDDLTHLISLAVGQPEAHLREFSAAEIHQRLSTELRKGSHAKKLLHLLAAETLRPFLAKREDLFESQPLLNPDNATSERLNDNLIAWKNWSAQCKNYVSAEKDFETNMRQLLEAVSSSLSGLADDSEMASGHIETLTRIAKTTPLTNSTLREAKKAIFELTATQTVAQQDIRNKKELLEHTISDTLRQINADANDIETRTERLTQITDSALLPNSPVSMRKSLELLVEEAQGLATQVAATKDELRKREASILLAQSEIQHLRDQLVAVSQKVKEDSLTGLLNRRGLEEAALRDISLAARNQQTLALALLDIDNFKNFNDVIGHDGGDEVLKYLATTLVDVLRPADSIARFGGEEFIVLLPHTNISDAKNVMIRAQRALTRDLWLNNHKKLLTFSSGVTAWRKDDDLQKMISRADHLMYVAKRGGKNKVIIDGEDGHVD